MPSELFYFRCSADGIIVANLPEIMIHIATQPVDISKYCPGLPPRVVSLVRTALAKNRDQRYESPQAMADAIDDI